MGASTSFSKAETEIRENKIKQLFGSGIHYKPLKISDPTPTIQGGYILSEVGIYPTIGTTEAGKWNIGFLSADGWEIVDIEFHEGLKNTAKNFFEIADSEDKVAFRIDSLGRTDIAKLHPDSIVRIKDDLEISNLNVSNLAVLGDSISTDSGGGSAGLSQTDIWWYKVAQVLSSTTHVNAVAGSCITTGGESSEDFSSDNRLDDIIASNPKVVFIFGGINDFGQDMPLGTFGSTDKTNLHGALRYIYNKLMTALPNVRIIHMTPLHTNYIGYTNQIPEYNGQNYLIDYIDVIKQAAQAFGVSVIDTNKNSGITQYNIDSLATDRIHGNAIFHTMIKDCVIREIKTII